MIWLRLINRQVNHLDSLEVIDGRVAILAYMGKYGLEHPGEKGIEDLVEIFYNPTQATVIDVEDLKDFDKFLNTLVGSNLHLKLMRRLFKGSYMIKCLASKLTFI